MLHCRQVVGLWFPLVLLGLVIYLVWMVWLGDRSWLTGVLAGVVLLSTLLVVALLFAHLRRAASNTRYLAGSSVVLTLADTGLGFSSRLGDGTIPWARIESVRDHGELLLLRFRDGGYTHIPTEALDQDGIAELKAEVRSAGGNVAGP